MHGCRSKQGTTEIIFLEVTPTYLGVFIDLWKDKVLIHTHDMLVIMEMYIVHVHQVCTKILSSYTAWGFNCSVKLNNTKVNISTSTIRIYIGQSDKAAMTRTASLTIQVVPIYAHTYPHMVSYINYRTVFSYIVQAHTIYVHVYTCSIRV